MIEKVTKVEEVEVIKFELSEDCFKALHEEFKINSITTNFEKDLSLVRKGYTYTYLLGIEKSSDVHISQEISIGSYVVRYFDGSLGAVSPEEFQKKYKRVWSND